MIRAATPADAEALVALAAETFPLATTPGTDPADIEAFIAANLSRRAFALGTAAVGRMLDRSAEDAVLELDGGRWAAGRWYTRRRPDGWYGLAVVPLAGSPPGLRRLTVRPRGCAPSEYSLRVLAP